jgi:lipoprotein-releasing system permease protein
VFMLQGTVIGLVGTATGGILGVGACFVLDRFRLVRVPETVYQIAWVPFRLQQGETLVVLAVALVICFLATLYPSLRAARLDPAEALRYE